MTPRDPVAKGEVWDWSALPVGLRDGDPIALLIAAGLMLGGWAVLRVVRPPSRPRPTPGRQSEEES